MTLQAQASSFVRMTPQQAARNPSATKLPSHCLCWNAAGLGEHAVIGVHLLVVLLLLLRSGSSSFLPLADAPILVVVWLLLLCVLLLH